MSDSSAKQPLLTIRPPRWFGRLNFAALWRHRDLLVRFAARDVTLRYRQTLLGVSWVVIQPLLAAGVFTVVFGGIAGLSSSGESYFLFSFAGLTAWTLFYNVLTRSSAALVSNSALVSKVFFPRVILPFSVIGSSLVDLAVTVPVLIVLVGALGGGFGWQILTLPLWFAVLVGQAIGAGLVLSALFVRFRDVQYVLPVVVQLLLFASPVAYGIDHVPAGLRGVFLANPLTGVLEAVRWAVLSQGTFPTSALYSVVWSAVLTIGGLAWFAHMEQQFADVI